MKNKSMIEILKELSLEKEKLQGLKDKILQLKSFTSNPILKKFLGMASNPEYLEIKGFEKVSKKILKEDCHHSAYLQHAYHKYKRENNSRKLVKTSYLEEAEVIEFICLDCGTSILIPKEKLAYFKYWHHVIYTGFQNLSYSKIYDIRLEYFQNLCEYKEESALSLVRAI